MVTSRPQIERAHEEPFVRQFSIFLPNRVGQLNELLEMLTAREVDVIGISVVDSTDWAVVRMVFSDPGKAREVLTGHKVAFTECDVLAVVLAEPRTLQQVCKTLVAAELNVQFAYPLLTRRDDCPVMVLHADDGVMAVQALRKHGFTVLDHEED
jgi:hypothetical protein